MTDYYLRPWSDAGWTDWDATVRIAAATKVTDWMWADLRGLQHEGTLPADAPLTACVWGWAANTSWVRLRVDIPLGGRARVCGAVLTTAAAGGDLVTVVPQSNIPVFRPRHLRGSTAVLDGRTVRSMRVIDRPLTFVEVT